MFEPLSQKDLARSFIAIVKRIGLKTMPCGIPFSNVLVVDKEEPSRTRAERN